MKKYKVNYSLEEYGYIIIEAESEEEAKERVYSGEYRDEDKTPKNGQITAESAVEITD